MMSNWTKVAIVILVLVCGGIVISLYQANRHKQTMMQQEAVPAGEQPATECDAGDAECTEAQDGAEGAGAQASETQASAAQTAGTQSAEEDVEVVTEEKE